MGAAAGLGLGLGVRQEGGGRGRPTDSAPRGARGWGLEAGSELSREQNLVQCGGRAGPSELGREGGAGRWRACSRGEAKKAPGEGEQAEPWVPGAEKALGRGMSGPSAGGLVGAGRPAQALCPVLSASGLQAESTVRV